jgi:hypothetical protein
MNTYRHFTSENVPKEIPALIGMVKAFPEEVRFQSDKSSLLAMIPPASALADIGWQLTSEVFLLVLTPETFNLVLYGTNADHS